MQSIPNKKSPEMTAAVAAMSPYPEAWDNQDASKATCAFCGKEATTFHDELSKREYRISRMCQSCQDKVYVDEDD